LQGGGDCLDRTAQPGFERAGDAAPRRHCAGRKRRRLEFGHRLTASASRQLADRLFEETPGLIAVFAFPLGVETGGAELVAERRGGGLVEREALAGEILLQIG